MSTRVTPELKFITDKTTITLGKAIIQLMTKCTRATRAEGTISSTHILD